MAKIARVYDGSAWVDLASSNTDLSSYSTTSQMNTAITAGSALKLINTTTLSAASTVTFSDAFSATYDNYLLTWNGLAITNSQNIRIVYGATTTGYYSQLMDFRSSAVNPTTQAVTSNGALGLIGNNWTTGGFINCYISNPFNARATMWVSTFSSSEAAISASGSAGGGLHNTTSYTAFTITPSAGTMTGTFRLYGLVNT